MYEQNIRWFVLLPMAIFIACVAAAAEISGAWFRFPARPDWLWCLVFAATLRSPPTSSLCAFALCGLVRDLILGPRLGAAMLAYILVGWLTAQWRLLAVPGGWSGQAAAAGITSFLAALLRHGLDSGWLAHTMILRITFISLADAAFTGVAYLPLALLLNWRPVRPWRTRDR